MHNTIPVRSKQTVGSNGITIKKKYLTRLRNNGKTIYYNKNRNSYIDFINRTKDVPNIFLIKKTSDDAVEAIKNAAKNIDPRNLEKENLRAFDFVYIDGMHTYEQVKKDIANYLPFIKEGGFIAGHDYVPGFQGVMDAVNEQFGSPDAVFHDTSWLKRV